jgi:acyl-CoA reductase-like NAD-dependent aldehyde dehydrogenase
MLESTTTGATLRHAAALALTDAGISAEMARGQWFSTYAEPTGVVAIIVPWNAPVALLMRSLGPALAAGNTVAVKMPGQTALVAGSSPVGRLIAALLEVEDVNSEIVQKEVFGPVATFEVFDTEAAAISRANAGEMGLAAGLFTNDINISRRVSGEIQAGTIWTNGWAAINDGFAEGGYKQSGIGRLRGPLAITEFQEAKTVVHSIPPASDNNRAH